MSDGESVRVGVAEDGASLGEDGLELAAGLPVQAFGLQEACCETSRCGCRVRDRLIGRFAARDAVEEIQGMGLQECLVLPVIRLLRYPRLLCERGVVQCLDGSVECRGIKARVPDQRVHAQYGQRIETGRGFKVHQAETGQGREQAPHAGPVELRQLPGTGQRSRGQEQGVRQRGVGEGGDQPQQGPSQGQAALFQQLQGHGPGLVDDTAPVHVLKAPVQRGLVGAEVNGHVRLA